VLDEVWEDEMFAIGYAVQIKYCCIECGEGLRSLERHRLGFGADVSSDILPLSCGNPECVAYGVNLVVERKTGLIVFTTVGWNYENEKWVMYYPKYEKAEKK
jgi:ssDNA-binding Zn-finger/Zn-ribbon topoisomerase 1